MKREAKIEVAEKLITLMETSGSDWVKPWAESAAMGHRNARTGRAYRGINTFLTAQSAAEAGWISRDWNTYRAWDKMGHQVAVGQRGTPIVFWKMIKITNKTSGETETVPFARMYTVFNGSQLTTPYGEGLEPGPSVVEVVEAAEELIMRNGPEVTTFFRCQGPVQAYYSPAEDRINMPQLPSFHSTDGYYATLFHELTHWSGHKSRLDRNLKGRFGSPDYAFEELIAELGAAMLCATTGVSAEPREDHAQYLNGWIKGLKDRPESVWQAFSHAQRAVDFLTEHGEGEDGHTVSE